MAVPLASYGVYCIVSQRAVFVGEGWVQPLGLLSFHGRAAVATGFVYLGLAIALHCHFVWGRLQPTWRVGQFVAVLGLVTALAAFAVVLYEFAIRLGNFPVTG